MMNRKTMTVGFVLAIVAAIVVIVLWPAPDPLRTARTIYLGTGGSQDEHGRAQLDEGLSFVLNDRNLTLVPDRTAADVELSIQNVSVNLGDVTVSLAQGGISGRVKAVCRIVDLRNGKTYTMDLAITVDNNAVSAKLVGRKFWEFWK
jgi:hypothetical protein